MCGGEADRRRPAEPEHESEEDWADYLYNSTNAKGRVHEWWWHQHGCAKWFQIERDTVTHQVFPTAAEKSG